MMCFVFSVSGVCSVMKSERRKSSSRWTRSTPRFYGALVGQEGVISDDLHFQAMRAVGDDGTDIAAADDAKRLGCHLDAHEA